MPLLPNINVGTTANDGTGDDLRTAFTTVNENFQFIEAFFPNTSVTNLTANITSTGISTFNNIQSATVGNTGTVYTGASISAATIGNTDAQFTGASISAATIGNSGSVLTGTLSTAAQTNITSLGTLSALNLSGNLNGSNVTVSGIRSISTSVNDFTPFITNGNIDISFVNGSFAIEAYSIDANLGINEPTEMTIGLQKTLFVKNYSGSSFNLLLFNNKNNYGTDTYLIPNGTITTCTFTVIDSTAANIISTISGNI